MARRRPPPGEERRGYELLEALEERLAKRIRRAGDELQVKPMHHWVAFRSKGLQRAFAELRPHRKDLEAFILLPPDLLGASDGLATAAPPTQGWGWFRTKFRIARWHELEAALDLLVRSYEFRKTKGPSGRGQRHK